MKHFFLCSIFFLSFQKGFFAQVIPQSIFTSVEDTIQKIVYVKHTKSLYNKPPFSQSEQIYIGEQKDVYKAFSYVKEKERSNTVSWIKYPIASFFKPSTFTISAEMKQRAELIYTPFIDSLLSKISQDRIIHLELLVLGFDDNEVYSMQETNMDVLRQTLQLKAIDSATYRFYISFLRAKELAEVLATILHKQTEDCKIYRQVMMTIRFEGRGTELPDKKRLYENVDSKRRIAKLFWRLRTYSCWEE